MNLPAISKRRSARIEIVPLIDIIFFLLATFVMVSLSMVKNHGLPVNLPKAEAAVPLERSEFTTITLLEDGSVALNKTILKLEELPSAISTLKNSQNEPKIIINGDERALLVVAVTILDELRKQGITKIAFETRPR